MDRETFQAHVDAVIASLPPEVAEPLKEVVIVVDGLSPRGLGHLGLYEGVPFPSWGRNYSGKLPDKITLFQVGIEHAARTPEEIPHVIRETLLHEIAHFLGHDHPAIRKMEEKWRANRQKS